MLKAKSLIEKLENVHKLLRIVKSVFKETSQYYLNLSIFLEKQTQKFKSNIDIFEIVNKFLSINQEASIIKAKMFFNQSERFGICHKSLKLLGNSLKQWISKGKLEVESEIKKNKNIKDGKLTYQEEAKIFKSIHEDVSIKIKEAIKNITEELTCFIKAFCLDDDNVTHDTRDVIEQIFYYKAIIDETFSYKNQCELDDYSKLNQSVETIKDKLANSNKPSKAKNIVKSKKLNEQVNEDKMEGINESSSIIINDNKKNRNSIEMKQQLINENNSSYANSSSKRRASVSLVHPKDLDSYLNKEIGSLDNESLKQFNDHYTLSNNYQQSVHMTKKLNNNN